MKTTAIITVAIALALAGSFIMEKTTKRERVVVPPAIHKQFVQFIKEHNKRYSTPTEFLYRLRVFYENIKEARTLAARNDITHEVGVTKFFDLTRAEFLKKYTGLVLSKKPRTTELQGSLTQVPTAVDWRTKGVVTPVKDQAQCGSCWAFSAIAATEGAYAQAGHTLTSLSEQQLVDCSGSYGNMGCNGGWMDWAFHYIQDNGIESETDYPYTARDGTCKADKTKFVTSISKFTDVTADDGNALTSASASRVVSVAVDANSFFSYRSGVIAMSTCGTGLNHGVTLVGYDRDAASGKNYWIIKNSWGAGWGNQGYVWLERDVTKTGHGTCGIRMKASYPVM